MYAPLPTVLCRFLSKISRCLGHGLKMCILFRYNPQVILATFFVIYTTKVNRYYVSSVGNYSYSFMPIPLTLYRCVGHGLKMCILFGYNPQIFFVTFLN